MFMSAMDGMNILVNDENGTFIEIKRKLHGIMTSPCIRNLMNGT